MSDPSKIQLSAQEFELVSTPAFILTKNKILQAYKEMLEQVQEHITGSDFYLPAFAKAIPPKISRGENYRGLPWLMLDYPRYFLKDDVCAIRHFFWWGQGLSVTLQLTGSMQKDRAEQILRISDQWAGANLCTGEDPWNHDWTGKDYRPAVSFSVKERENHVRLHPFLKINYHSPLLPPEQGITWMTGCYSRLVKLIRNDCED